MANSNSKQKKQEKRRNKRKEAIKKERRSKIGVPKVKGDKEVDVITKTGMITHQRLEGRRPNI